jgi:hypothetical protein
MLLPDKFNKLFLVIAGGLLCLCTMVIYNGGEVNSAQSTNLEVRSPLPGLPLLSFAPISTTRTDTDVAATTLSGPSMALHSFYFYTP